MNKIINIIALILMAGSTLFTSCTEEEIYGPTLSAGDGSLTLQLSVPDPIVIQPETRAGVSDFNTISDLNVVIAEGNSDESDITEVLYYTYGTTDGSETSETYFNGTDKIHFSKDYVGEKGLTSKSIFVVVNWGSKINVDNVGALKSLKQETNSLPGNPVGCMMFAEAKDGGSGSHITNDEGTILTAELERTVTMITVKIDGSQLNDDVIIQPRSISLHRVPKTCFLGKPNEVSSSDIVERGTILGEYGDLSWVDIPYGTKTAASVSGGHYETKDFSDDNYQIAPLFMFENYHGSDFGAKGVDEKYKRPASCDATTPEGIHNDPSTETCSYLDVEVYYVKMKDANSSLYSGTVHYRLFLGENITDNFDVMRNTYYKVTLQLSGNAVLEGGQVDAEGNLTPNSDEATWRVETDLAEASFATGDIYVNASGEFIPVTVDVAGNATFEITGTASNYFLWAYNNVQGEYWSSVAGGTTTYVQGNTIWLYAQPWVPQDGSEIDGKPHDPSFDRNHTRSQVVTLRVTSGGQTITRTITITQYEPIVYEATGEVVQKVFGTNSVTMYIDRVDREAMPWGFDGEVLDQNANDGFHNTYHLIEPNPICGRNHRNRAETYLPWGKQNGGSAMIYATTFWDVPQQQPSGNPEDMINSPGFPDYDEGVESWNKANLYWTLPSIAGWQMIEKASKEGELDSNFPIIEYLPYWTSNAVTLVSKLDDGDADAYTYQFGRGLDVLTEDDIYPINQIHDRREKLRFRLVAVHSNNSPFE